MRTSPGRWPGRAWCLLAAAIFLLLVAARGHAASLNGPRILDSGRLDQGPAAAPTASPVPSGSSRPTAPPPDANHQFTLRAVRIVGKTTVDPALLAATWRDAMGRTISVADAYAIADRVAALCKDSGLALYSVGVLDIDFATGTVRLRVLEGYVAAVEITGDTKDADLSLIQHHTDRILADRPLRQATLEREILLTGDIPGVTAGSRFEPIPGTAGAVRLVLTIQRKSIEPGAGVANQGNPVLAQTQANVNLGINSMFREGDRTDAVFGFPVTWDRYQYYGLSHIEPLGDDGATVAITGGDLVTRPSGALNSGNAELLGLKFSYPLIRGVNQNLFVTGGFDYLNSNNAVLGTTTTDERTRALRLGLAYSLNDPWKGHDEFAAILSQGLDILGARRGTLAAGGPEFTKVTLRAARAQELPWMFVARVRMAGQAAGSAIPLSEQFAYGGPDFGQAFDLDTMTGDQGFATATEIAWAPKLDLWHAVFSGSELFASIDWGKVWNRDTLALPASNTGASAGAGMRVRLLQKVTMTFEMAKPLIVPKFADQGSGWRFVFGLTGSF